MARLLLGSMAVVTVWRWAGYYTVMVVAGMSGDLARNFFFEAAELDGANAWHKFVSITLPQLKPVLTYIILMCVIGTPSRSLILSIR
ncbi:MAG: ABC transporter permease subunit [Enterocloster sp.]